MSAWVVVVAVGVGSYLFRVSMLVVAGRMGVPAALERATRFAIPTAFAALVATSLGRQAMVAPDAAGAVIPFVSVTVAVVVARRTGSSQTALLAGLPTLWILSALWH